MAEKVVAANLPPAEPAAFEYELFEGDPDHLRTVAATSNQSTPWIDPTTMKLRHRIGRGLFGDVWLATHHQSSDDYEEYHEVAVKNQDVTYSQGGSRKSCVWISLRIFSPNVEGTKVFVGCMGFLFEMDK